MIVTAIVGNTIIPTHLIGVYGSIKQLRIVSIIKNIGVCYVNNCSYATGCAEEIWLPYSAKLWLGKLRLMRPAWSNLDKLIMHLIGER